LGLLLWPLRKKTRFVRLRMSIPNQKHPGSAQRAQKKSASLLGKDIIRDQRAP
jgi:hypothetical protein